MTSSVFANAATAVRIAAETAADFAARDILLDRAMAANWRRKASEKLRRGRLPAIALVARDGSASVIGTVRLWSVEAGGIRGLLLGPLAVDPGARGSGTGSALMRAAIAAARDGGHGAILLMGDPEYYGRFGFTSERTGDLAMPGPFERHRLLALELRAGALDGARGVLKPAGLRVDPVRRAA